MSAYTITNAADLTKLDAHFKDNLYCGGHSPSNEDLLVFNQFAESNTEPNQDSHSNLWAWFALISLYTQQIKETWVAAKAAPAKKAAAPKKEAPKKAAADDDMDLFGDDDDAEADAKVIADMKAKKEADAKAKKPKPAVIAKSLILLDIKVWDPEQDYDALAKKCIAIEKDGLFWKTEYQLKDVAFGVKKIVIGLVVEDEKVSVDDVVDIIESWEDDVQSVDIAAFNKI